MTKYVLYIDHRSGAASNDFHQELVSKDITSAMYEADRIVESINTKFGANVVYLWRIMTKQGKQERAGNLKYNLYKDFICNRGSGWHPCTASYSEMPHTIRLVNYNGDKWFEY